jgi:hypothetical protein
MALTIDKKTGRKRRVDPKRSRAAKSAARKRKGKHLSVATKRKIALGEKKTARTGRTKTGRRVLKKTGTKAAATSKAKRISKAKAGTKRAAKVGTKPRKEKVTKAKTTMRGTKLGAHKGTIDAVSKGLAMRKPAKEMLLPKNAKGKPMAKKGKRTLPKGEAKSRKLNTYNASPKVKMPAKRSKEAAPKMTRKKGK